MVGCDEAIFDEQIPLLKAMGTSVVRTGEVGSGNVTKLVNQVIVALNIAALSEALVLGKKSGVDPQLIFEAIRGGLAGSTVMNAKTPMMLERNFKPGFKIDLHIKDLVNALETSREVGVSMPLTGMMMQIMLALRVDGKGQLDHSAIISFYEKLAKMEDSVPVQQ
jgi:2-hydroxy-3-oxopropionate reductase